MDVDELSTSTVEPEDHCSVVGALLVDLNKEVDAGRGLQESRIVCKRLVEARQDQEFQELLKASFLDLFPLLLQSTRDDVAATLQCLKLAQIASKYCDPREVLVALMDGLQERLADGGPLVDEEGRELLTGFLTLVGEVLQLIPRQAALFVRDVLKISVRLSQVLSDQLRDTLHTLAHVGQRASCQEVVLEVERDVAEVWTPIIDLLEDIRAKISSLGNCEEATMSKSMFRRHLFLIMKVLTLDWHPRIGGLPGGSSGPAHTHHCQGVVAEAAGYWQASPCAQAVDRLLTLLEYCSIGEPWQFLQQVLSEDQVAPGEPKCDMTRDCDETDDGSKRVRGGELAHQADVQKRVGSREEVLSIDEVGPADADGQCRDPSDDPCLEEEEEEEEEQEVKLGASLAALYVLLSEIRIRTDKHISKSDEWTGWCSSSSCSFLQQCCVVWQPLMAWTSTSGDPGFVIKILGFMQLTGQLLSRGRTRGLLVLDPNLGQGLEGGSLEEVHQVDWMRRTFVWLVAVMAHAPLMDLRTQAVGSLDSLLDGLPADIRRGCLIWMLETCHEEVCAIVLQRVRRELLQEIADVEHGDGRWERRDGGIQQDGLLERGNGSALSAAALPGTALPPQGYAPVFLSQPMVSALLSWLPPDGSRCPRDATSLVGSANALCVVLNIMRLLLLKERSLSGCLWEEVVVPLVRVLPLVSRTTEELVVEVINGMGVHGGQASPSEADEVESYMAVLRVQEVLSRVLEIGEVQAANL